ncbi:unnamed protein product [Dracunculus medinensis]|uniref:Uncharacterized protein n=1 Tax=Dracunculus medinensis TaxID=318479 RepID=A0A0N4UIH6_DRAME|nr:unnamed protein product [Dracunculus medinensis]
MGGTHSHEDINEDQPEVVRIDLSDIPDEYKNVGVSDDVVNRVKEWNDGDLLAMDKLTLVCSLDSGKKLFGAEMCLSLEELEERKRAFNEAIERVEKQFFSYQRENACSNSEQVCSGENCNRNRLLNCTPIINNYGHCVKKFREDVLVELTKA